MLLISKEIFVSLAFITFFYYYNYPDQLNLLLLNVQTYIDKYVNKYIKKYIDEDILDYLLIGDGCSIEGDTESDFDESSEDDTESDTTFLKEFKYEDKYLDDIRKLNKEFIFDDEEKELEEKNKDDILTTQNNKFKEKINGVNVRLKEIETELKNTDTAEYKTELLKEELESDYCADILEDEEIMNTSIDNRK